MSATAHRALWDRRLGSLCRWWSSFEPILGRKDRVSREHRIAHHVVSAAVAAGKLRAYEVQGDDGKRVPAAVWRAVHALCESDWPWIKETTRAYVAAKEAERVLPAPARERPRPVPDAELPPPPAPVPGGGRVFDEFDEG